jgi:hypothetical protein
MARHREVLQEQILTIKGSTGDTDTMTCQGEWNVILQCPDRDLEESTRKQGGQFEGIEAGM